MKWSKLPLTLKIVILIAGSMIFLFVVMNPQPAWFPPPVNISDWPVLYDEHGNQLDTDSLLNAHGHPTINR